MIRELIEKNRSYRRFKQDPVDKSVLKELVDMARLSPSAANLQPVKYLLSADNPTNRKIFPCLSWAGKLKDWPGPNENQRPVAYIVILGDTGVSENFGCDHGIAAQSILLGAVDKGLGGCMLGAIDRNKLRKNLDIPDHLKILMVVAIGKPDEQVILESTADKGDISYWRDNQQVHHVPKRPLDEIIIN